MIADILDALATYLNTNEIPVYYPDIPRTIPTDVSALPQFAVITAGGDANSAGDRSYIKVARPRADIRCYGPNGYRAMETYRKLADRLKALVPTNVDVGPLSARVGVRLHNATLSAGPVGMVDPDTQWPFVWAAWAVHGSEIEVAA